MDKMSEKRYAIVRVDARCPDLFEKINNKFVCELNGDFKPACKNCRYGDTKEQLVEKITQILFKEKIKHFIELFGKSSLNKKWKQIYSKEAYEQAKEIVEFLGVK